MHVAIRELALLVAVAAGSAEAFAPAPTALSLRGAFNPGASPQQRQGRAVAAAPRSGVLGLAALQNADKIGRIVPRTWKEGTDYAKAAKVLPDRRLSSPQPPALPSVVGVPRTAAHRRVHCARLAAGSWRPRVHPPL